MVNALICLAFQNQVLKHKLVRRVASFDLPNTVVLVSRIWVSPPAARLIADPQAFAVDSHTDLLPYYISKQ
jgi:hypothetical protein